jgi:prepilin-type N-terminal cleavage/methylation domain-containing protein
MRRRGFTLFELMIALVILVVALGGLLLSLTYCILLDESNNNLVIAVNDARYTLEQIKGLDYDAIADYVPPTLSNLDDEAISLTRSIGAKIAEVTVDVSWTERARLRNVSLSTRIAR